MEDFSFLDELNCDNDVLVKSALQRKWELLKDPRNRTYLHALGLIPPRVSQHKSFQEDILEIGLPREVDQEKLTEALKSLMPWKKGPFRLFGILVDGEWRSDFKWNRIRPFLPNLEGKIVLDIGCNNGQFLFRLLPLGPKIVLGIDPMFRPYAQFRFLQSFVDENRLKMALWSVEHLKHFKKCFDVVLSLGIIYHHKGPIDQLLQIRSCLKDNGTLILESLGVPGEKPTALFVRDKYAGMKNIWFIPTLSCLTNWAYKAKFKTVQAVSSITLTTEEQRSTQWSGPVGPKDFLDPKDESKTIEGHPAPMRFCLLCKK